AVLDKNPADAEANLAVGRWRAFYKNDWPTGLPLLAKGSDEKLKSLAAEELKSPTDAEQQIQLADAWWNISEKEAGIARDCVRLHAGSVYQEALPNLASALKKAAIEKRLKEIADLRPTTAMAPANGAIDGSRTSGAIAFPLDKWVDVLGLVDVNRDRVAGSWARTGTDLVVVSSQEDYSRLALPVDIDGGYDFEVEFTRKSGDHDVAAMVTIGSHASMVMLSGSRGSVSGLLTVNGQPPFDPQNPIGVRPGALENGHRYRLLIRARMVGENRASIDVLLDGKQYLPRWVGSPTSLDQHPFWAMPNRGRLGLGVLLGTVAFHSARLRMVSGHATAEASVADSGAPGPAPTAGAPPAGICRITSKHGQLCLGTVGDGKQSGNAIGVWADATGADRLWEVIPIADGKFKIINEKSGKCMGIVDGSTGAGAFALEWSFENAPDQRWLVERAEGGAYKFMNDKSGLCLGLRGDGPTVELQQYTGSDAQQWTLAPSARADRSSVNPNAPTIVSARWGRKTGWADVADRVRQAIGEGLDIEANVDFLRTDPAPGKRKNLQIVYNIGGVERAVNYREGGKWAKQDYQAIPVQPQAVAHPRPSKGIDLLAEVDTDRDTASGNWLRRGGTIVSEGQDSRIVFPHEIISSSYELQVEFSRDRHHDAVWIGFPVAGAGCNFVLSSNHGKASGLDMVDGQQAAGDANPTMRSPSVLENGRRYIARVVVKVKGEKADVRCFLDDQDLVAWTGNPASLKFPSDSAIPQRRVGFGDWQSACTIYSVRLLK
ncbi:MAG TPA: RICIN domain-containing protein, partial [Pirellulales bacterium]|nr:RICIN domain-containing protein [Pirellulales bacterium]